MYRSRSSSVPDMNCFDNEALKRARRKNSLKNLQPAPAHISTIRNLNLIHRTGNPTSRRDLEYLPLEDYDSILVLADEELEASDNPFDMVYADSRSLTCLLLIRDILGDEAPRPKASLLSEILDPRTKSLISVQSFSDYVTSNNLVSPRPCLVLCEVHCRQLCYSAYTCRLLHRIQVSMAIAMVAEQRDVGKVLQELFSTSGNKMYVGPIQFRNQSHISRKKYVSPSVHCMAWALLL